MKVPKARKLPSGAWRCQVLVDGKRISVTQPTEKKAVAQAMAIKEGIAKEKRNPQSISLQTAYARYIDMKDGVLSPSTIVGYKRLSKNTFQNLMPLRLDQLTQEKIQREISAMSKDGKSQKYITNASGLLSSVLKTFYGSFDYAVTLPPKQKQTQRGLTEREIKGIVDAVSGTSIELPVLMALQMGMRLSEIRGARYEDIVDGRLHICRAVVEGEDGYVEKSPKTFSGDRWVHIPQNIKALIGCGSGNIVSLTHSQIYKRFSTICAQNGIEHCRFHDLRHANAAIMIRLGIDSKYAQERNGWKSDYMYKQVYGYIMDDKASENDKAIEDYFAHALHTEI